MNSYSATISMASIFEQSIAQYAPLRTFARLSRDTRTPAQLIHELFPKALFHKRDASRELLFEIAWSFLSQPIIHGGTFNTTKEWKTLRHMHRVGGLPAIICTGGELRWHRNGLIHRDDKDPNSGLALPAWIHHAETKTPAYEWRKNGQIHRADKDARTGLTLPAIIDFDSYTRKYYSFYWYKNGNMERDVRELVTGSILPSRVECCV